MKSTTLVDLVVGDERAVQALHARRARRQEEHVALAEQALGADRVEDRARVDARRHLERDARREVRLDEAGDDVDRRPLRREDQVDAGGARLLREARDRLLDLAPDRHHQVGELVDDDDDARQVRCRPRRRRRRHVVVVRRRPRRRSLGLDRPPPRRRLSRDQAVVAVDVAHALLAAAAGSGRPSARRCC